jgi:hypothetical protein
MLPNTNLGEYCLSSIWIEWGTDTEANSSIKTGSTDRWSEFHIVLTPTYMFWLVKQGKYSLILPLWAYVVHDE